MKPRLLDLFCSAGGAAKGYQRAGFYVVGVDVKPQPRYCGDEFHQADAMTFPLDGFDAIHASPPCQGYSKLAAMHRDREYPDLIDAVRQRVRGSLYVIENVEGAPLAHAWQLDGTYGILLCGASFSLGVPRGALYRHRAFESSVPLAQPPCAHLRPGVGVYGHGGHTGKHRMLYKQEASEAMGIDWMTRDELCQAIPPAYTEFIGKQLIRHLQKRAA